MQGAQEALDLGIDVLGIGVLIARAYRNELLHKTVAEKLLFELVEYNRISVEMRQRITHEWLNT